MKLLLVGGGFTGAAVARRALAAGHIVTATTRSAEREIALAAMGITPLLFPNGITPSALRLHVDAETAVLVTFPPDGETDRHIAPALASAAALAYVSSTAVYGGARGRVDETTPIDPEAPRAGPRLEAEATWAAAGAVIVRAPAIYGPGRGMHLRLARGELQLAGEGHNVISRVHVDDLAAMLFGLLLRDARRERNARGGIYVAGDREPAPHREVVQWIGASLGLGVPAGDPSKAPSDTLRNDRWVDPSRLLGELKGLGIELAYPTYREGYAHCIAMDRAAIESALSQRGEQEG